MDADLTCWPAASCRLPADMPTCCLPPPAACCPPAYLLPAPPPGRAHRFLTQAVLDGMLSALNRLSAVDGDALVYLNTCVRVGGWLVGG